MLITTLFAFNWKRVLIAIAGYVLLYGARHLTGTWGQTLIDIWVLWWLFSLIVGFKIRDHRHQQEWAASGYRWYHVWYWARFRNKFTTFWRGWQKTRSSE